MVWTIGFRLTTWVNVKVQIIKRIPKMFENSDHLTLGRGYSFRKFLRLYQSVLIGPSQIVMNQLCLPYRIYWAWSVRCRRKSGLEWIWKIWSTKRKKKHSVLNLRSLDVEGGFSVRVLVGEVVVVVTLGDILVLRWLDRVLIYSQYTFFRKREIISLV